MFYAAGKEIRKTRICMTIDKDLAAALRILAKKDGRSLSQYINYRLRLYVRSYMQGRGVNMDDAQVRLNEEQVRLRDDPFE